jgi:hypothetical protein
VRTNLQYIENTFYREHIYRDLKVKSSITTLENTYLYEEHIQKPQGQVINRNRGTIAPVRRSKLYSAVWQGATFGITPDEGIVPLREPGSIARIWVSVIRSTGLQSSANLSIHT